MAGNPELNVDFDQYQRYKAVQEIVSFYRLDDPTRIFTVLEIGSNEPKHLRLFLPNDNILFTDIELTEKMKGDPEFQLADGTALPFGDGAFDFVVATDVLEHIPPEKRHLLCSESFRVAKITAILTFPYASPSVLEAENRISSFYQFMLGEEFIWLKQHAELGLPEIESVQATVEKLGCYSFHCFHGNLYLWESMYYSVFEAFVFPEEWPFHRLIDNYYIHNLYQMDTTPPCYRAFFVLSHEDTAPLEAFIETRREPPDAQKLEFLKELLHAQQRIRLASDKALKQQLTDKDARINELQRVNAEMHQCWERDVSHWKQDIADRDSRIAYLEETEKEIRARWEQDVGLWEQDVSRWKQDITDRDSRIAYLEETEKEIRARWEQDVKHWEETAAELEKEKKKWFRIP